VASLAKFGLPGYVKSAFVTRLYHTRFTKGSQTGKNGWCGKNKNGVFSRASGMTGNLAPFPTAGAKNPKISKKLPAISQGWHLGRLARMGR
jgi:hypothetical protein